MNMYNLITQKINGLGNIQNLQSSSETELFNLVKDRQISVSKIPTVNIYSHETHTQQLAKVNSKKWYNASIYDTNIQPGCTISTPCFLMKGLIYIDSTTSQTEHYGISIFVEGASPCNVNPVANVLCVSTSRLNTSGIQIDLIVPSTVIQEANSLLDKDTNIGTVALVVGAGVVIYLLLHKK